MWGSDRRWAHTGVAGNSRKFNSSGGDNNNNNNESNSAEKSDRHAQAPGGSLRGPISIPRDGPVGAQ